tara:strand:- start:1887 stop:2543 length:657 start_codon:yes stop_codon:yes gene_type:complete
MKKSELKKSIKEEILDILEAASSDDVKNQQNYNAELEKTAKLSSDLGLTENVNPEVHRLINGFIRKMADKYDYSLQDAVYAIMQVLKSQKYDGVGGPKNQYGLNLDQINVNEGNDSDKSQDDGYVDKKDVDDTTDLYVHSGGEEMAFEQVEDDEEKEPTASQLKKEPLSKIGYKLADTQKEMKKVVKKWKDAEGVEKEKLTNRLRELTKIKKELEGLL